LNITKNFYFKSNLKITIKKIKKNKIYSTKVIDSISTVKTVEKKVVDTVYNILNEKKYTLTPTLDITRNSNMNFPIIIESDKNVIGWGYWIGLDSTDIENYSNLEAENEPLKDFAKSELTKSGAFNSLPKTSNTNIELIIKNETLDARSLNYSHNYAFFKSDVNFPGKKRKAEVLLTNRSKIYDYPIVYKIVTVNLESSIQEVDEVFITKKEYINLTLQINE